MIDLHVHSNYSDGLYEPAQVIENAVRDGLDAVALCDHDCTLGLAEAGLRAKELGIEFVSGVELSVSTDGDPDHAAEIHILGLFIRSTDQLKDIHERMKKEVNLYASDLSEAIRQYCNVPIYMEDLHRQFHEAIGIGAFVRYMFQKKLIKNFAEFSEMKAQLENEGKIYNKPNFGVAVEEAIEAIHTAGGLAILAHPYRMKLKDDILFKRLSQYKAEGLDGVETYYTSYNPKDVVFQNQKALEMAKKLGLLVSGGSDYHNDESEGRFRGQQGVPNDVLSLLKSAWKAQVR